MIDQYNRYHFENKFFDNPKKCGGLFIYQLGEMLCHSSTVILPHNQPCYELTYVLSGSGTNITNNVETPINPGDCTVNFPGDIHSIVSDEHKPLRYAFCGFMPNPDDPVCTALTDELLRLFHGTSERLLRLKEEDSVFYELFAEINSSDFMAAEMITALLSRLLILLIRAKKKESKAFYAPRIKSEVILAYQIQQYLLHHICEIKNLTDLEPLFNYNYRYLTKCFKKTTGETLGEYHTRCRMNTARKLLSDGLSVTRVSDTLKYSSIHVFTRSFKNYFGMTPTEYRRNIKQADDLASPKGDFPDESHAL